VLLAAAPTIFPFFDVVVNVLMPSASVVAPLICSNRSRRVAGCEGELGDWKKNEKLGFVPFLMIFQPIMLKKWTQ
jgi:hypothetical protein